MQNRLRLGLILAASLAVSTASYAAEDVKVCVATTLGSFDVRLDAVKAPVTVKNFLAYVKKGHYDGTIFHRVIDGFMIQGGGFTPDMTQKPCAAPIINEARSSESNRRGTIAMARTNDPHSATSQFFINTVNNDFLDAKNSRDGWGYAVFGRVVRGMDVVDKISVVRTGKVGYFSDVPVKAVVIKSIKILPE